jgi:membrane-bound serine protease (ClpP class)
VFRLLRLLLTLAAVLTATALPALGQEEQRRVEVLEVSGPLDARALDFLAEQIHSAASRPVELVVLQLTSPGVVASRSELEELAELVSEPPLPLAVWIGPAPGRLYGGALQLAALAPLTLAAPGVEVGHWTPTIAGDPEQPPLLASPSDRLAAPVAVEEPIPGVVDELAPSIRQLLQALDERTMTVAGTQVVVDTIAPFEAPDGTAGVAPIPTVFRQPGLWTRFLRLAATPEAAFFFLVAGLTVAVFELYAIGPGIAAGVAAVSLGLAGYGMAVLPVRGWAVGLTVVAIALLAAAYQRGGFPALSALGMAGVAAGGLAFTAGAPQIEVSRWGVVLTVAAAGFFFLLAMPTVARARFSTQTIGREHLVGRKGRALSDLSPEGLVEVDGARWHASSHREAGIRAGDAVTVAGVDGWTLEVEPAGTSNQTAKS